MPSYASAADVALLYGPFTPEQTSKAARLLDFAEALVRQQVPGVDARLLADTLDPDALASVVTAMVGRVMQNPFGRRQGTRTIDDYSESWTVDEAMASGGLYLSDGERVSLMPVGTSRKVRTVRTRAHGEDWPSWRSPTS